MHVQKARLFELLAEEFSLTPEDLASTYQLGKGKVVSKWEQTIRVLQQELKAKGIFASAPRRGVWKLSAAGRRLGKELIRRETEGLPVAPPPTTPSGALRCLGFEVENNGDGMHPTVTSPLPGVLFTAVLVEVSPTKRASLPRTDSLLLVVYEGDMAASLTLLPEGSIVLSLDQLIALAVRHQKDPIPLDIVVQALKGAEADRGAGLQALTEGQTAPDGIIEAARLVLNHSAARCEAGISLPIEPEHVYWYALGVSAERVRALDLDRVRTALDFLSSPSVGAFRKEGKGYILVMRPNDALMRLSRVAGAEIRA